MTGTVDDKLGPLLPVAVSGPGGRQIVLALVDTGYTGSLTLPAATISVLGLVWLSEDRATLADGSSIQHDVYAATLDWDGVPLSVSFDESDSEPLIGMQLLAGRRVVIDAEPGGLVEVGPIPPRPAPAAGEDPFP